MREITASRKTEVEGCMVIVFPLRWRHGKARRTAEVLLSMSPKARTGYLNRTLDTLEAQLARIGCGDEAIARELQGFVAAVQAEIDRMHTSAPEPDGAA